MSPQRILRRRCFGIQMMQIEHVADQTLRRMFVGILHDHRTGDELMMQCLVRCIFPSLCHFGRKRSKGTEVLGNLEAVIVAVENDAAAQIGDGSDHVDLVEGQPVFDLILVLIDEKLQISEAMRYDFRRDPAVVVLDEDFRQLIVDHRDQRFDVVLMKFCKDVVIEFHAFRIRRFFQAGREESGPGDRHPERPEAHLGQKRNVFLVAVIEIDASAVREVECAFLSLRLFVVPLQHEVAGCLGAAEIDVVEMAQALAVETSSAFYLGGACRTAP